jgi:hypothetical protein
MKKVAILILLASITGCAFGTRHAELSYPPSASDGVSLIASAHQEASVAGKSREVVVQVSDQRDSRERIGNVRNGFGMDTADVITNDDLNLWVKRALISELANAGYTIVADGGRATGDDAIALDAEILEVYCDVYISFDADVSMRVTLSGKDIQPLPRTYEGDGSVGVAWDLTAKGFAESLSLALQDAISKILADMAEFR